MRPPKSRAVRTEDAPPLLPNRLNPRRLLPCRRLTQSAAALRRCAATLRPRCTGARACCAALNSRRSHKLLRSLGLRAQPARCLSGTTEVGSGLKSKVATLSCRRGETREPTLDFRPQRRPAARGHGRSAITGAVYWRRFGRACKCRLNVRPPTINAATASGAVRPNTRRRIAPARAPANIATTDSTRRAVRPPATEESATSPVSVNVRTGVVRSGTASFRTTVGMGGPVGMGGQV